MRLLPRLIQLLPEPALSQVPGAQAGAVGRGARGPAPPRLLPACARAVPDLLFEAVSETLAQVARTKLQATIGFTAILHTWNQQLGFHPHLHCLVPAGGLSLDASRWIDTSRRFFLPVKPLRKLLRGKLLAKIECALRAGEILGDLPQDLSLLRRTPKTWNVYAKPPLAGPGHVVRYLSRYVHRIAIANSRITDYDGQSVTFRYKDRADSHATKTRTVSGPEFARLFLQHVLPPRFVRIRHYGLLAARGREDLDLCRQLMGAQQMPPRVTAWAPMVDAAPLSTPSLRPGAGRQTPNANGPS